MRQPFLFVPPLKREQFLQIGWGVAEHHVEVQPAELNQRDVIEQRTDRVVVTGRSTPVQEILAPACTPDPVKRVKPSVPHRLHSTQPYAHLRDRKSTRL